MTPADAGRGAAAPTSAAARRRQALGGMGRPQLTAHSPWHVVRNPGSGSAGDGLRAAVAGHPDAGRRVVHWHEARRGAQVPAVARKAALQAQRDGGVLVAAGGDGTLNAVASAAWPLGLPVGVLAQGTFNYFSRQHGLPESTAEAVDLLAQACSRQWLRPVQVGQVNGQLFVVNASLGHYPRLLAERESASRRLGRSRGVALLAALGSLLRPLPGQRWCIARTGHGGEVDRREVVASTLFVGNNALQFEQLGLDEAADGVSDTTADGGHRDAAGDRAGEPARSAIGCLQAVTLAPAHRWAMARLLWRAATARLAADPLIEHHAFRSLELGRIGRGLRRSVRVAFDGESATFALPLHFQVGAHPLWLVAPPRRTEGAAALSAPGTAA